MKTTMLSTVALAASIALLAPGSPAIAGKTLARPGTAVVAPSAGPNDGLGADLALSFAVSPWDPEESGTLVYTVTVANVGKSAGSWASVTSPLAEHLEWLGGAGCRPIEGAVVCAFAPLAAGESRQRRFELEVLEPYPIETIQEATLTAADPDPVAENNFARVRTVLDVEPPVVEMARALFEETGRRLRACTQLAQAPRRLELTFSEPMQTDVVSWFVDAASSYRLVRPGANGTFEEPTCSVEREGGLPSDDIDEKILGVDWDEDSLTAQLELAPGAEAAGSSGHYRLIACDSLTDLAGNPIDGDGDGQGGDAAVVDFRVDEGNLIENGHFDCNVDYWIPAGSEPDSFGLGDDSEESLLSHSGRIESASDTYTLGAGQCVVEPQPGAYQLSVLHRVAPGSGEDGFAPVAGAWVGVACTFYESSTCDGMTQLAGAGMSAAVPDPGDGTWGKLIAGVEVPTAAGSLLCTVAASSEGEALTFEFDQVRLMPAPLAAK